MDDTSKDAAETGSYDENVEADFIRDRIFDPRQNRGEQESQANGKRRHPSMLPGPDARVARAMSILQRKTGPHRA